MIFDEVINRIGTHCDKWDTIDKRYGVSPDNAIAMWVADMDFRPPQCVADKIAQIHDHGIYGYFGNDDDYRSSICWWMENRHNWLINPSHIFTTHGLVHGTAMCIDTYTEPGDGIILFTPVYHAFARIINAADRHITECPLINNNGRFEMDFETYDRLLTGKEKILILCSPHNPGGTLWTLKELRAVADFAIKNDLIILSDEIHHDLVMPGKKHHVMTSVEGIEDRLIMMTAPTKTFNIAGCHTGNIIIADPKLRAQFAKRMSALGISGNSFGLFMTEAAYSPMGAEWVEMLMAYLQDNARVFDEGINGIKGAQSMTLESTYLAWVEFADTGLSPSQLVEKIQKKAQIVASHGITFGQGGETCMRFNLGLPRTRILDAVARLQACF